MQEDDPMMKRQRRRDDDFVTIVGVAGPSGSGKSTLVKASLAPFLSSPPLSYLVRVVHGDGCFQRKKCKYDPELGRRNVEVPRAYNYRNLLNRLKRFEKARMAKITPPHADDDDDAEAAAAAVVGESDSPLPVTQKPRREVIIMEGFLLFCGPDELLDRFDVRLFLYAEKEECYKRRVSRRTLPDPAKHRKYFDRYVWPCFLRLHAPILEKIAATKKQKQAEEDLSGSVVPPSASASVSALASASGPVTVVAPRFFAIDTTDLSPTETFEAVRGILTDLAVIPSAAQEQKQEDDDDAS